MKKLLQILLFTVLSLTLSAQVNKKANKVYYETQRYQIEFDTLQNYPTYVHYYITKFDMNQCNPNFDRSKFSFKAYPKLKNTSFTKDYKNSGYDKGHNIPAEDAEHMNCAYPNSYNDCWYFINITPQTPELNRNGWRLLEEKIRDEAKVQDTIDVYCGSYTPRIEGEKIVNPGSKVHIPEYCWKVYYIRKTGAYKCYLFENKNFKASKYWEYEIEKEQLEIFIKRFVF